MNIIKINQQRRAIQIREITASIKKAREGGNLLDKKKLLLQVMSQQNLSKRTAQEYIDVAFFNIENVK